MKVALSSHLKSVLYMDRGMLVLNKLPGLTCQLTGERDSKQPNRISKAENEFGALLTGLQKKYELSGPLFPVHRLDIGTTGCLALAVTPPAAREMSRQFAQGTIHKTYLALVQSGAKGFPGKSGRVKDSLRYKNGFFDGYSSDGKPSITEWELLADSPIAPLSLVRLNLLTGHKHQLRIHLSKTLNAPILGDDRYSQNALHEAISSQAFVPPNRIFLHASQLSLFKYRTQGGHKQVRLGVHAPLPSDFVGVCHRLRIPISSADIDGGLTLDGKPVQDSEIPDLGGKWLHTTPIKSPK